MEEKVKLINAAGKVIRVMPHMVEDAISHFGATREKKQVKEMPQELLKLPNMKKVDPLPAMETKEEVKPKGRPKAK